MKAIFLDFDGVLHDIDAGRIEYADGYMVVTGERLFEFMPLLAELLVPHPHVWLVIHSSWKNHYTLEELRERFPESLRPRLLGVTEHGADRHESILAYAEAHGISDYLVLDDMPGFFPEGWPPLVACDPKRGIHDPSVLHRIREFLK